MDNEYTIGEFQDELKDVHTRIFDSYLDKYFYIIPEKTDNEENYINSYFFPKIDNKNKVHTGRVDFILIPKFSEMKNWANGIIAIECKKSGIKIGKALAQCIDYANSVVLIKKTIFKGFIVKPSWTFLFPVEELKGDVVSVAVQNRVGTAHLDRNNNPKLMIGGKVFFSLYENEPKYADFNNVGNKQGAR